MENNTRVGRGVNTDFTNLKSEDGFVTITGKREGRAGYIWVATCLKPGCMCVGTTFKHDYLVAGHPVKCGSSGHDSAGSPVVNRPTAAHCEVRMTDDARYQSRSARAQMENRQRAEEIAALEGGNQ